MKKEWIRAKYKEHAMIDPVKIPDMQKLWPHLTFSSQEKKGPTPVSPASSKADYSSSSSESLRKSSDKIEKQPSKMATSGSGKSLRSILSTRKKNEEVTVQNPLFGKTLPSYHDHFKKVMFELTVSKTATPAFNEKQKMSTATKSKSFL
jgi:hypothetical protein